MPLKGLPDLVLEVAFVNGLSVEVQAEMRQTSHIEDKTLAKGVNTKKAMDLMTSEGGQVAH